MLKSVGSWGVSLIIWGVSGIAALCGALCWTELSTIFPKQGGTYIFIKEGLGDYPSFLYITTRFVSTVMVFIIHLFRVFLLNPCANAVQALAAGKISVIAHTSSEVHSVHF